MRAVTHARVSSDKQDADNSIGAQIGHCKAYALEQGWIVVAIYVDEARSGRSSQRPQFQLMTEDAMDPDRPFDKALVWKNNRFARNWRAAVHYKGILRDRGASSSF